MEYEMGVQFSDDDQDKRKKKSEMIKKKAIKFTKIISLVGLRHATDSRNSIIRRFVWLLWVVFGLVLAVYQIQERISEYYTFPSDTEVKLITDEGSLLFPQVTICDDKPEHYTSSLTKQVDSELKKLKEAQSKGDSGKHEAAAAVIKLRELLDQLHNETSNWDELSKNKSLTAADVDLEVSFNNKRNSTIEESVITELGHCFAFSTVNHSLKSNKAGTLHGLSVRLKASAKDNSVGFKVFIHDPLVIPNIKHDGIELRPGTVTRIAVSLEQVTYLGLPYDLTDPDKKDYRLVSCLKECDYKLFEMQYDCRDIHMTGIEPVCSYANILNFTRVFAKQENTTAVNCSCGPECYSRNYKTAITQTTVKSYGQNVYLYVYYQRLAYMRLKNVAAFTFLELLCEIGGALSLLLGATLLTVYETVEFLLLFIKDYLHMRFAK